MKIHLTHAIIGAFALLSGVNSQQENMTGWFVPELEAAGVEQQTAAGWQSTEVLAFSEKVITTMSDYVDTSHLQKMVEKKPALEQSTFAWGTEMTNLVESVDPSLDTSGKWEPPTEPPTHPPTAPPTMKPHPPPMPPKPPMYTCDDVKEGDEWKELNLHLFVEKHESFGYTYQSEGYFVDFTLPGFIHGFWVQVCTDCQCDLGLYFAESPLSKKQFTSIQLQGGLFQTHHDHYYGIYAVAGGTGCYECACGQAQLNVIDQYHASLTVFTDEVSGGPYW